MMHIQNISSPKVSFTKSCCENKPQEDKNVLMVFSTPAKVLSKDVFQKQPFEGSSSSDVLLKEQLKNDLATRIIAFQQEVIKNLQKQIDA